MLNRQSHAFAIAKMTLSFLKYLQICAFDRKFLAEIIPDIKQFPKEYHVPYMHIT